MSTGMLILLFCGSVAAGWVDAVVGGGGLILIPLLLITNPGFSNAQALGVNKIAAISGTGTAAVTLARKVPSAKKILWLAPVAALSSAGGALVAANIDKEIMRPVIVVLLICVGTYIAFRPDFGQTPYKKKLTPLVLVGIAVAVVAISFYDGVFGPGTGLFLIMAFTTLLGSDFITSAAWAKIVNVFTNLGALLMFAYEGEVLWKLGIFLAVGNIVGAFLGARMVLSKGTKFIRIVILIVVVVMATKLGFDQYQSMIAN